MEYLIQTRDVFKDFSTGRNTAHVLKGINIGIHPSTLTLLKGRSGSGKTTLMNILGVLDRSTAGKVLYKSENINAVSDEERDRLRRKEFAFVFQSVALLSNMTVYENVEFMLRIARQPVSRRNILSSLERVGMEKRAGQITALLSGGEQQRVAIARAMVHNPSVIFADEPTSQLDSKTSAFIMDLFKKCIAEDGTTVIMTSHDDRAAEAADFVFHIEDGKIADTDF